MDEVIPYSRSLNRPTYIFWRLTINDAIVGSIIMLVAMTPSQFVKNYPTYIPVGLMALFSIYRATVIALKPRGWDYHVIKTWFTPKRLNPGHTIRMCFIG